MGLGFGGLLPVEQEKAGLLDELELASILRCMASGCLCHLLPKGPHSLCLATCIPGTAQGQPQNQQPPASQMEGDPVLV